MKEVLREFTIALTRQQKIEALAAFVRALRPGTFSNTTYASTQLADAIDVLELNEDIRIAFAKCIFDIIESSRLVEFFTETGIPVRNDFSTEFFGRLRHKVLPELTPENHLSKVLQVVFPYSGDWQWIEAINDKLWHRLLGLVTPASQWRTKHLETELSTSLSVLSIKVASSGLEKPIAKRLPVEILAETFSEQAVATDALLDALKATDVQAIHGKYQQLRIRLKECHAALTKLKEQSLVHGTSLEQTFLSRRIEAQLQQMEMIAAMLFSERGFGNDDLIAFFKRSVYYTVNRYAVSELFNQNIGLLSYQIAEHKSKSGEHYITITKKDFRDFFVASCKGGVVIAFVVIAKIFIHHAHVAAFWEAVLFSLNYAAGFIIIHVTHSALATKQPAMTASRIAASLDSRKGEKDLRGLAILVARTTRSQIISFAGNLLIVFPLPFLFAYLISMLMGETLVSEKEALGMLKGINPFQSLAWLYAAFTGVFLFLSGIISGYWDNRVIYAQIPERIRQHPRLKNLFSARQLDAIASYVETNAGALVGNFALGFFLGTAASIGVMLGIAYDIRHITIAAGNYAIGILGAHHLIGWKTYLVCFIGVLGIGFINFLVSFTLAFIVAVKSRGVEFKNLPEFWAILWRFFKKYPGDFIRPPLEPRKPEELT